MKKFEFILLVVFCLLGINNMAYTQEQDTVVIKDSIAKKKLDEKLIKLTKQVVLKHGRDYYREYKEPVIKYRRVSKSSRDLHPSIIRKNMKRIYYTVEYPYDMEKEIFDIKHEMLTMQSEIDKAKEKIKELSDEKQKAQNEIIRLETELGRNRRR